MSAHRSRRILHLGKYYPPVPGGVERFVADLAGAQARAGHDVAVLVHRQSGYVPAAPAPRLRVIEVPTFGTLWYAPLSPTYPFALRRLVRRWKPDVIHAHLPNTSAFWLLAAIGRDIPLVIHWHADVVASTLDWRLRLAYRGYRPLEGALLERASAVVATSPPYLASSQALTLVRERCRVVPLGLDASRFAHAPGPDPWPVPTGRRILAVGRLAYYKGLATLIRAMALAPELDLAIVGDGPERKRLEHQIDDLALGDRVRLCGAVGDDALAAWLAHCDVLCLPSVERTEAFGVVLLEAMHYGKPVVVTDVAGSGMRWVTETAGHGVVVPTNDAGAIARELVALAGDAPRRRQLGECGRLALARRFSIDAVARELDGVYDACGAASPLTSVA